MLRTLGLSPLRQSGCCVCGVGASTWGEDSDSSGIHEALSTLASPSRTPAEGLPKVGEAAGASGVLTHFSTPVLTSVTSNDHFGRYALGTLTPHPLPRPLTPSYALVPACAPDASHAPLMPHPAPLMPTCLLDASHCALALTPRSWRFPLP